MMTTLIVVALRVVRLLYRVMIHNNPVSLSQVITQGWANIDVLLEQPHDGLSRTLRWQAWAWLAAGVVALAYGGAGLLMRA